jgi:hypothetical protein
MRKHLIFSLMMLSTAGFSFSHAQIYQWKDSSGKTVISDSPPPASIRQSRTIGTASPASNNADKGGDPEKASENSHEKPAAKEPSKSLTLAEKEAEFRKRQQESKEKAEREASERAAQQARRENCEASTNNYRLLQSDTPVSQVNARGELVTLSTSQRQQELERTRKIMQEACK